MSEEVLGGDAWNTPVCKDEIPPQYIALNFLHLLPVQEARNRRDSIKKAGKKGFGIFLSFLEAVFLSPVLLCSCCLVLFPSAVYFIPRDLLPLAAPNHTNTTTYAYRPFSSPSEDLILETGAENCSQGFYFDVNFTGSCRPSCEEFRVDHGVNGWSVYRIVVMAAGALSCASALCFVALAVTVRRKAILSFPRTYFIYMCVTSVPMAIIFLIGAVRSDLFCSAEDLITSSTNGTLFCTFSGIFFSYISLQLMIWTAFQAVALLWMLASPGYYSKSKGAGQLRFLHSLSIIVAVVVPMVTSLLQLEEGFEVLGVPSLLCLGRNKAYVFYTLSFPISLVSIVPACSFVISAWMLLKNACKGVKAVNLTRTVKLKSLLVILYAIIAGLSITSCLNYYFIYDDVISQELNNYYSTCASVGTQTCPVATEHVDVLQGLVLTSAVLVMLYPLAILLLNTEIRCKSCRKKENTNSEHSQTSVHSFTRRLSTY